MIIDVETWKSKKFAFGIVYFPQAESYKTFYNAMEMRNYILSFHRKDKNSKKIMVYGHNIGYDLNWIFGNYEIFFSDEYNNDGNKKRYWKKLLSRNGIFYESKYYNLIFRDTMNLFIGSLENAGKMLGYEKDIKKREKFEKNSKPLPITNDDIVYCLDDCKITYKLYLKYKTWADNHGIELSRTISSTAMRLLKKINPNIDNYIKSMNKNFQLSELDEQFKNAYFGGRTEVYKKSGNNLKYYDVNSLYPSVMANDKMKYPNPETLFEYKGELIFALNNYEGLAYLKMKCPDNIKMPVLPVKNDSGKIIYPKGIIKGCYCFPEIRLALDMGYIILDVEKIICGMPIKSPFYDYIKMLYSQRLKEKQNNDGNQEITKRYMNHAYGKFGQRDYTNKLILLSQADDIIKSDNYEIVFYKGIPYVRYITDSKRSRVDLLCLASYVTSYARTTIYNWYKKVEYDVYYSDTDSIITGHELKTGSGLGEMKLEYDIIYASFKGRKDYYLELENKSIIKRKGCSLKMVTALEYNGDRIIITDGIRQRFKNGDKDIIKMFHDSDVLEIDRIIKTREGINRDLEAGRSFISEKSRLTDIDDGRIWINDESKPIYIPDNIM